MRPQHSTIQTFLQYDEVGSCNGRQFIATEYVEGETLRQRMLPWNLSLAEALDFTKLSLHVSEGILRAINRCARR